MRWKTCALATLVATSGLAALPAWAAKLDMDDIALEGQLRFLAQRPDPEAYRYEASATIDAQSLQTGVVTLRTCHLQLDPNRRIVVAFNRERVQHIEILESTGVGRAWVEGHRVELAEVQRGGHVCIGLRSRALEPTGEGALEAVRRPAHAPLPRWLPTHGREAKPEMAARPAGSGADPARAPARRAPDRGGRWRHAGHHVCRPHVGHVGAESPGALTL